MVLDNKQIGLYFILFLLIVVAMLRYSSDCCCRRDRDYDDYRRFDIDDDSHVNQCDLSE